MPEKPIAPSAGKLTLRELNRATLARQMLLQRKQIGAVEAIERLAGLQAQYSPSPYIALWSRLEGFEHDDLESALLNRELVKTSLMRWTLHIVSARDYPYFSRAVIEARLAGWKSIGQQRGVDIVALHKSLMDFISKPRLLGDIKDYLAMQMPSHEGLRREDVWYLASAYGGLVHVPPSGTWKYFGKNSYIDSRLWLEGLEKEPSLEETMRVLVEHYLLAYGPATRADIAQWSGIHRMGQIDVALQGLGNRLIAFSGENGSTLYDLEGAPHPAADIEAPPRFLPKWDNLLLAYDSRDRERILPERYRKAVIRVNGEVLPTFLVDGVVAGMWSSRLAQGRATLSLEPFEPLSPSVCAMLEEEGERLIRFVEPDAKEYEVKVG